MKGTKFGWAGIAALITVAVAAANPAGITPAKIALITAQPVLLVVLALTAAVQPRARQGVAMLRALCAGALVFFLLPAALDSVPAWEKTFAVGFAAFLAVAAAVAVACLDVPAASLSRWLLALYGLVALILIENLRPLGLTVFGMSAGWASLLAMAGLIPGFVFLRALPSRNMGQNAGEGFLAYGNYLLLFVAWFLPLLLLVAH